mmetsp:Transcript_83935/g.147727  ORF Transcript_83935/g.147727 Transcript_83935/m.147727 type:complete len:269 (+) Transcript_83935:3189-3995(+)
MDGEQVVVMEVVGLWRVQEGVLLSLRVKLVSLGLRENVFDVLSEAMEFEGLSVGEDEGDLETEELRLGVCDEDWDRVLLGVLEIEFDGLSDALEREGLPVQEGDGDLEGLREALSVGDAEGDSDREWGALRVSDGVSDRVSDGVSEALKVWEPENVGDTLLEAWERDGDLVGEGLLEADSNDDNDGDADGLSVRVSLLDRLSLRLSDAVAVSEVREEDSVRVGDPGSSSMLMTVTLAVLFQYDSSLPGMAISMIRYVTFPSPAGSSWP